MIQPIKEKIQQLEDVGVNLKAWQTQPCAAFTDEPTTRE